MLTAVKDDLFRIAKRLRFINRDYRLFFNNKYHRFEVHNTEHPGGALSLCFVVPFDRLDQRTLDYAHRTRVENFDDLEAEIGRHNRELENSAGQSMTRSGAQLHDMMQFAASQMHEVVFHGGQHKWF